MPWTYILIHKNTKEQYYGVRTAKNSNPEDLWTKYFSSSNIIKDIIAKEGKDIFDAIVDKVFDNAQDALNYERKVLNEIPESDRKTKWLNESYGSGGYNHAKRKSLKHRQKIGKGNSKPKTGAALMAAIENAKKGTAARRGMKDSLEVRKKRADSLSASTMGKPKIFLRNIYCICGKEYIGIDRAAKATETSPYIVRNRCSSDDPQWNEWILIKGRSNTT
jgi:hypothetical protein